VASFVGQLPVLASCQFFIYYLDDAPYYWQMMVMIMMMILIKFSKEVEFYDICWY